MPRFRIPSAIFIGAVILVVIWLAFKPVDQPPIGVITPSPVVANVPIADNDTLAALQATIAGLLARLEILETEQKVAAPSTSPAPQPASKPAFQTQVIYLGSASTTQREWTESGAQAWLNSASYPADVKATFEAGLSIIGGEAWARVKNKTSGAVISVSEVFHNTGTVAWKSSPAFKLHQGNNLYVVEIKSSSDELANLAGSRIQLSQ